MDWKDKDLIYLQYVTHYQTKINTANVSIAKTYEDLNEMRVTLEIPKSDYKNKSFQNLLK